MNFPNTKKEKMIEKLLGIKVSDPYRWLEDSSNPSVKEWINNQNKFTNSTLRNKEFSIFSNELVKNFKVVNFSNPSPVKGRYFYTERQPDEEQSVLYMKDGLAGVPVKLVDTNGLKKGNTIAISYWEESWTGKYLAYGLDEDGKEMPTIYIKDVDMNKNLEDTIVHCRYSSIRWLPDDSAFFYTRNPRPGTVPKNEEHLHTKVYFHRLGDDPDNDELIFGADRPKDDMLGLSISLDGRYLGIYVSRTWTENDIYIYDRKTKEIRSVVKDIPSKFFLTFLKDKVILYTNYKANNYRLLTTSFKDMYKKIDGWKEFVPERKFLLESVGVTKDKIILQYLTNACSKVVVFNYKGKEISKIPLPKYSSLAGLSTNKIENEFFYGVNSFTFPKKTYYFNPKAKKYSLYRKTDNPIEPQNYETEQEWFTSKDGTKVPMFIFHKKGLLKNGLNPTILYGYGGFGINQQPSFMRNFVPWIERGGVFVVANIRGGGEFGEKWHKSAIKENKQNSFDDFIGSAEYLISQKYTNTDHLGIMGGSNGGLLVCTVAIQRPNLFRAVCSRVPITDMVRFPKFGIAVRWIHEYGNPEIRSDLENILRWSPYHNIKKTVEYPVFLFMTADKDSRVDPMHARKMTAILQSVNKTNNVCLFTEFDAGHSQGRPISKLVENQALLLSFFSKNLGLVV